MVRPWSERLPVRWLVLGTVLPDLIDKPLYYTLTAITGRHGNDLGLICGTRTIGHTLLLAVVPAILAWRGSLKAKALTLGLLTHLILDFIGDLFDPGPSATLLSAFFPLLGAHFYALPYDSLVQHLAHKLSWYAVSGEIIGGTLLLQEWWMARQRLTLKD